jgi:hypothetical protein
MGVAKFLLCCAAELAAPGAKRAPHCIAQRAARRTIGSVEQGSVEPGQNLADFPHMLGVEKLFQHFVPKTRHIGGQREKLNSEAAALSPLMRLRTSN